MFPARAGMSPAQGYLRLCYRDVPRASGDEGDPRARAGARYECSPRERG